MKLNLNMNIILLIFIIFFVSKTNLFSQSNVIWNLTQEITDPAKRGNWRVFYQRNNSIIYNGDGSGAVLVNYDNDPSTTEIQLTSSNYYSVGAVWYKDPINLVSCGEWNVDFEFRCWGGTSTPADGLIFAFLKNPPTGPVSGSALGTPSNNEGFLLAFDTYANISSNSNKMPIIHFQEIDPRNNYTERAVNNGTVTVLPNNKGVALSGTINSLKRSSEYIRCNIIYTNGVIEVFYYYQWYTGGPWQRIKMLQFPVTNSYLYPGYIYFSASTGAATDNHSIRNVKVTLVKKNKINASRSAYRCNNNPLTLDAGVGYNKYEWRRAGSNTILGTNRTLTVNQLGKYIVSKESACEDALDTIEVKDFANITNPLLSQVDSSFYDVITGNEKLEIYLCGSSFRNLTINHNGVKNITWYKNSILLQTGQNLRVDQAGDYKVIIEFSDPTGSSTCPKEYSFEVFKSNLSPTFFIDPSSCNNGRINKLTILNSPNCTFSLNGITYQSSNEFHLPNIDSIYIVYIKDNIGGCIYTINNVLTRTYISPKLLITPLHELCRNVTTPGFDIIITGGRIPYNIIRTHIPSGNSVSWNNLNTSFLNVPVSLPDSINNYNFKIIDNDGCTYDTTVTIIKNDPVNFDLESINNSCNQIDDGKIIIKNTRGGTPPYVYSIDGGITFSNDTIFDNLSGSKLGIQYNIVVKDINNCEASSQITISKPDQDSITEYIHIPYCIGDNSGYIEITKPLGGNYEYSIDGVNFLSDNLFTNITAGNYTIYCRDNTKPNACMLIKNIIVSDPAKITPSIDTVQNLNCVNSEIIKVKVTGGTPPYFFSFDGGYRYSTDSLFTYLIPGNYNIFVQDSHGCMSDTIKHLVKNTDAIESLKLAIGSAGTCPGDINNTSIYDIVTAISSPAIDPNIVVDSIGVYKYPATSPSDLICIVANSNNIPSFNISDTTLVRFVITNGGCKFSLDTLIKPVMPALNIETSKNVSCFDGNDGKLKIIFDASITPQHFPMRAVVENLDDNTKSPSNPINITNSNDSIIDNLYAGQYKVTITDNLNCNTVYLGRNIIITQPTTPIRLDSVYDITNPNTCNRGHIRVSFSGGWRGYTYHVYDSLRNATYIMTNNSGLLYPLDEGYYKVGVKDNMGCVMWDNTIIKLVRDTTPYISTNFTNSSCFNSKNGTIKVYSNGFEFNPIYKLEGPISIDYELGDNDSTKTYNNLPPGNYKIYVVDISLGCIKIDSVKITEPKELIIDSIQKLNKIICHTDLLDIKIHASGGNGIFDYGFRKIWNSSITWQKNDSFTNLDSGSYFFYVKDTNNCTAQMNFDVIYPDEIIIDSLVETSEIFCMGDNSASLYINNISGGISPYKTRLYKNGAPVTNFTNNKNNYINLSQGTYKVEVEDFLGCLKFSNEITFFDPPLLVIDSLITKNLDCYGGTTEDLGSVNIYVSGGVPPYQYNIGSQKWYDNVEIEDLYSGRYTLTVRDSNGCVSNKDFIIMEPSKVQLKIDNIKHISCKNANDGIIRYSVKGGTPPYKITFESFIPVQNIKDSLNSSDTSIYVHDSIMNISPTSFGILKVIDNNGCYSEINGISIEEPNLNLSFDLDSTIIRCKDGNNGRIIIKNVTGGWSNNYEYSLFNLTTNSFTYNWGNSSTFNNLTSGDYIVGVKSIRNNDTLACKLFNKLTLSNPTSLNASASIGTSDSIVCFGEKASVKLNIRGGQKPYRVSVMGHPNITNIIQNTDSAFYNLESGSVSFRIMDARGCEILTAPIRNNEPNKITITSIDIQNTLCFKSHLDVIVTGVTGGRGNYQYKYESLDGSDYIPYSNTNKFSLKSNQGYYIYVRDADYHGKFCEAMEKILVKAPNLLDVDIYSSYDCETLEYTVTLKGKGGTPPYNYTVYDDMTGNYFNLSSGNSFKCFEGKFSITIHDGNNCDNSAYVKKIERIKYEKLQLFSDVGDGYINFWTVGGRPDILITRGSKGEIITDGIYRITWDRSDTINAHDNRGINMDIFDSSSCVVTKMVEGIFPFEIPNFFTPDGDGVNDILEVIYNGNKNLTNEEKRFAFKKEFPDAEIKIFDKHGILLFRSYGKDKGWDGTFNGSPMPSDDYWCIVNFPTGHILRGPIRLKR